MPQRRHGSRNFAAALAGVAVLLAAAGGCSSRAGPENDTAESTPRPVELPPEVAEQWAGKVVVADFWAIWCGPCRASSPNVQILHERFADRSDVLVVGVHADDGVRENPADYLDEHGYTYALVPKGQAIARSFGVVGLPTFVVLDREGREVMRHVGMMNQNARDRIEAKVRSML